MGFWSDLASPDNAKVSTPQVLSMVPQMIMVGLGTILMGVSIVLIIYHCFYHRKGIDGDTVKLILGLMGGGVLNAGASYFSRTTATTTVLSGPAASPPAAAPDPNAPAQPPSRAKPAPTQEVG